jgi:hypothetical protein
MEWVELDPKREEVLPKVLTLNLRYEFDSKSCVSAFLIGTKLVLPYIVQKSSKVFSSCSDIASLNLLPVENWKAIIGSKGYLKRRLLGNLLMWVKESSNNLEYLHSILDNILKVEDTSCPASAGCIVDAECCIDIFQIGKNHNMEYLMRESARVLFKEVVTHKREILTCEDWKFIVSMQSLSSTVGNFVCLG